LNIVTTGLGILLLFIGLFTAYLHAYNPNSRLLGPKLEAMKKAYGQNAGFIVHLTAYSIVPITIGIIFIIAGYKGISLF
jgi:hypothetical protein